MRIKKKESEGTYDGHEYTEEECYIIIDRSIEDDDVINTEEGTITTSSGVTYYFDPTADPIVCYEKLSEYYSENNYTVYNDNYYVKAPKGEVTDNYDTTLDEKDRIYYKLQSDLIDPNNCYYKDGPVYKLVMDSLGKVINYDEPKNINHILVLQNNNDYFKYEKEGDGFIQKQDVGVRYVYNSYTDYITVLYDHDNSYYNTSKSMIVVLNKPLSKTEVKEEKAENKDVADIKSSIEKMHEIIEKRYILD